VSINTHVDHTRYRVKLNHVHTRDMNGTPTDPTQAWRSARENNSQVANLKTICTPTWLGPPEKIQHSLKGTIVLSFGSREEANQVLASRTLIVNYDEATMAEYEERPSVRNCSNCGSLTHPTGKCQVAKCMKCSSAQHSTEEHTENVVLQCINCGGSHRSDFRDCPSRLRKIGKVAPTLRKPRNGKGPESPPLTQPKGNSRSAGTAKQSATKPKTPPPGEPAKFTFFNSTPALYNPDWANQPDYEWGSEPQPAPAKQPIEQMEIET
jgi:hypothetical protein